MSGEQIRNDGGGVGMGIHSGNGILVFEFDRPLGYLRMSKDEAAQLAHEMVTRAERMTWAYRPDLDPIEIQVRRVGSDVVLQFNKVVGVLKITRHATIQVANEMIELAVAMGAGVGPQLILPAGVK